MCLKLEKPVEKEVVKKTVVATTAFLADQAKQLAGDFINVKLLIPAERRSTRIRS